MATKKNLNEGVRARYLRTLIDYFTQAGEEVLRTASNEVALPCLDEEGNETFVVVTVKVPTGSRSGDAYDGYAMAEDFRMKQEANAAKAKEKAEAKARKIARDKRLRESKEKGE